LGVLYSVRKMLKVKRKEKGLSLTAISKDVGISRSYYAKIENGSKNPSLRVAKDIGMVLGESVDDLFNDDENYEGLGDE